MKKIVKILSLTLVFILLLGVVPTYALEDEPLLYVALGDSIAKGTGVENRSAACYGAIIANSNNFEYKNYAVGGHETTDLLARLQEEEVRNDVINADIISISIGGNDFTHSGLLKHMVKALIFNDYSGFDEANEIFYTNYTKMMAEIKNLNSEALIIIHTLYNPRYDVLRVPYQEAADRINSSIYKYLEENPGSCVIVDVGTLFDGDESLIAQDDLHPSAKGQVLIAETIQQCLYELGYASSADIIILEEGIDDPGDFFENLARSILNMFLKIVGLLF